MRILMLESAIWNWKEGSGPVLAYEMEKEVGKSFWKLNFPTIHTTTFLMEHGVVGKFFPTKIFPTSRSFQLPFPTTRILDSRISSFHCSWKLVKNDIFQLRFELSDFSFSYMYFRTTIKCSVTVCLKYVSSFGNGRDNLTVR